MPRKGQTKLTPEVHTAIVASIRRGAYLGTAAEVAGIAYETLIAWRKKGREDLEAGGRRSRSPFAALERDVSRGMAEVEEACVSSVLRIGQNQNQWTAFAWFLERTRPHKFGRAALETTAADGFGPMAMSVEDQATLVAQTTVKLQAIQQAERLALPQAHEVIELD